MEESTVVEYHQHVMFVTSVEDPTSLTGRRDVYVCSYINMDGVECLDRSWYPVANGHGYRIMTRKAVEEYLKGGGK